MSNPTPDVSVTSASLKESVSPLETIADEEGRVWLYLLQWPDGEAIATAGGWDRGVTGYYPGGFETVSDLTECEKYADAEVITAGVTVDELDRITASLGEMGATFKPLDVVTSMLAAGPDAGGDDE